LGCKSPVRTSSSTGVLLGCSLLRSSLPARNPTCKIQKLERFSAISPTLPSAGPWLFKVWLVSRSHCYPISCSEPIPDPQPLILLPTPTHCLYLNHRSLIRSSLIRSSPSFHNLTVGRHSAVATSGRCCVWLTGFLPSPRHSGKAPQGYVSRCIPPLACHPNRSGRSGAGTSAAARTCRTCPSQNRHATLDACRSSCNPCRPHIAAHIHCRSHVAALTSPPTHCPPHFAAHIATLCLPHCLS
jgi:hypothetical protein